MGSVKQLAGQTLWYGVSSIAARFINYLLTPLLTYAVVITKADYGKIGLIYSALPVLNVLFTYGFETAYFRFSSKEENKATIYNTAFLSILFSTLLFSFILYQFPGLLGGITGLTNFPGMIRISIAIIALDTLSAIPFARLRQENKPRKFAFVNIAGILLNIFFTWLFISYCPAHYDRQHPGPLMLIYNPATYPVTYVLIANLIQAVAKLLLLSKEVLQVRFRFNTALWKEMMLYAMPLLIVGFGGVINEVFDRLMLRWWLPGSEVYKDSQVGVYNACYKLSILITLFIQAFRMSAEPFFFKQAQGQNPQKTYARVMKFFVIIITVMFLVVSMYLDVWKLFIGEDYRVGLKVVPILLLANMFLGIYYNLSVWFKLSNKTNAGARITLIGTAVTLVINFLFIPFFSYTACAWATFFCYGTMMVVSFKWGQKAYRIPYAWKKLVAYLLIVILLFFIHKGITYFYHPVWFTLSVATLLLLVYLRFLLIVEKKEFAKIPVIQKLVR